MVLEIADIRVQPGTADEFVAAFHGIKHVFDSVEGFRSARLTHGIESPERFVLLIEWDSVEAHVTNFRGSPLYAQWGAAVGPFFAQPPFVEHVQDV